MTENELQVFIDGVVNYFNKFSADIAEVGSPYLVNEYHSNDTIIMASIGISGKYSGMVYFFAPKILLTSLLTELGEKDLSNENTLDLAGEAANTIAGNARKYFGKDFMISTPVVKTGGIRSAVLPQDLKSYAIPIMWKGYKSMLILSV